MARGGVSGNHRRRILRSRRLGTLEVIAIAAVLVALAVYYVSRPHLLTVPHGKNDAGTPIIIGDLQPVPAHPVIDVPMTIRVSISADRAFAVRRIAVRVQDPRTGDIRDLDGPANYTVGTAPREFTVQTTLTTPGAYRYWLAYDQTGSWVKLEPFLTLAVR